MFYRDFLVLSRYLNRTYGGCFTPAEVTENARVYYSEWLNGGCVVLRSIVGMVRDDIDYMPERIRRIVIVLQEVEE